MKQVLLDGQTIAGIPRRLTLSGKLAKRTNAHPMVVLPQFMRLIPQGIAARLSTNLYKVFLIPTLFYLSAITKT